ncbi:FAD-binding oxidoreductase [Umboniibacter marinipuniceus]|uniref:FAD/FMN-containing dehydrogenase n=1 Tax=Umboniibacter marinipuniceus TaxID=569599 RepID=A0A3M0A5B6_9GAMM|nr:FAD-binding oxidoreductase [Umboniibacter marinipuniceus]RMA80233.1 FAD/FMN-containing dehydrogenase [Umboniibacter marinipuniceus]
MNLSLPQIEALRQILGDTNVLLDEADLQHFGGDWCRQYSPKPSAIAFPTTTEQVQAIVRWANTEQVALVPSGGRTGLSGGATALNGELVIALDKMNKLIETDVASSTLKVEAGMVTAQLQQHAEDLGLFYPVDFASSGSSQIGGNIATNAGGIKVIRYGMTRDWVAGLTVVTGSGELLELNKGLLKNNTGYDLRHLFVGSEGTLGIITEATIRLCAAPKPATVLVLGVNEMTDLMSVLASFQQQTSVNAFEFFSHNALEANLAHSGEAQPLAEAAPYYALVEVETASEVETEAALACFEHCLIEGWVVDGVMSQSEQQAASLWRLREGISESIAPRTPYKNDLSVSVSKVPAFLAKVDSIVAEHYPTFEVCWFGHIGDGNLHLNILKPEELAVDAFVEQCKAVSALIFEEIARMGGSVSAEHGVGLLKKHALSYSRSEEEVRLMKQMRQLFDPAGILNPGKLFD